MSSFDLAIIGAGPAGLATAVTAARAGVNVVVFEKHGYGRDKVCGDGLTPRAVGALHLLGCDLAKGHRIDGLRLIANNKVRELEWPQGTRFPAYGAVWPRGSLDAELADMALEAGSKIVWNTEAVPIVDNGRAVGVIADGTRFDAEMTVLAAGAVGKAARVLGADRRKDEPFGLAIRTYAESSRHDDRLLEACLTLKDESSSAVPGYGWLFPVGDGTVNVGVGALNTMRGFDKLNLNRLISTYKSSVEQRWQLGPNLARPRAWRLPMSTQRRHGPGWVAVGDAAGLINPMNGEGIDYAIESGMAAAESYVSDPLHAPATYDRTIADRYDEFLATGRRFSLLIGHPKLLSAGLRLAVGTDTLAALTLQVMGNLIDSEGPSTARRTLRIAHGALERAEPLLRRIRP